MTQKKTLVIILSEVRAADLTFSNFKKNVIDQLNADLCICVGMKADESIETNPFYKFAKYRFIMNEYSPSFQNVFEHAYNSIDKNKYEKVPKIIDRQITCYGKITVDDISNYSGMIDDSEIVFENGHAHGINYVPKSTEVYKKSLHWTRFLDINGQFMGGVGDRHKGSAGILIFFRWYLWKNIHEHNLLQKYDRFIITRSDFIYTLPHPNLDLMNDNCIWIPDCEHYDGYTDRHVVLSGKYLERYLNILYNFTTRSNEYFDGLSNIDSPNLEKVIKFHLSKNNVLHLVREFPYVMYSVRAANGVSRWQWGSYSETLGYYIKYQSEYERANYYKKIFDEKNTDYDSFYKQYINYKHEYHYDTPIDISTLPIKIIKEYGMNWRNINICLNGVTTSSASQVPDVCKEYMKYLNGGWVLEWPGVMIDKMLDCCKNKEYDKLSPGDYPGSATQFVQVFTTFADVKNKKCLVMGSISPWVECLLLHFGASEVFTSEYNLPICEYPHLNFIDANKEINIKFDIVISFSSLEHMGLGRYGDKIAPNADLDSSIEIYDILNTGGMYICGIPVIENGEGYIDGNMHRIYDKNRIDKLFSLFKYVGKADFNCSRYIDWQYQPIFVYMKE